MSRSKTLLAFSTMALIAGMANLYAAPDLEIKDGSDAPDTKSLEQQAAEIKAAFDKSIDTVKELAEKAVGMAEKNEKSTADQKDTVDDAVKTMNELKTAFDEFEQKIAREGEGKKTLKTPGQRFVESDEFKSLSDGGTVTQGRVAAVSMKSSRSAMVSPSTWATRAFWSAPATSDAGAVRSASCASRLNCHRGASSRAARFM